VVGGDGTMSFGQKFIERGATKIVGVPKTIDNDLDATDDDDRVRAPRSTW
jgi:6-phosphofructokinase